MKYICVYCLYQKGVIGNVKKMFIIIQFELLNVE